MKLAAVFTRYLQAGMQAELRDIERAAAAGTHDAGRGLKTELRRQIASARPGQRLAKAGATSTTRTGSSTRQAWSTRRRADHPRVRRGRGDPEQARALSRDSDG
jgi:hypothetical protein